MQVQIPLTQIELTYLLDSVRSLNKTLFLIHQDQEVKKIDNLSRARVQGGLVTTSTALDQMLLAFGVDTKALLEISVDELKVDLLHKQNPKSDKEGKNNAKR